MILTLHIQVRILEVYFSLELNDFLSSYTYLQVIQVTEILEEILQILVWDVFLSNLEDIKTDKLATGTPPR